MLNVTWRFCGDPVSMGALDLIKELVEDFAGLSRTELAATVCETLGWLRPNEKPKSVECLDFLTALQDAGLIDLPPARQGRARGSKTIIRSSESLVFDPLETTLDAVTPLRFHRLIRGPRLEQWKDLVERFHYLGFKVPFGAQVRYLVTSPALDDCPLACLQFSSPAWKLKDRDAWIGWTDAGRKANLQRVIQNSRFLILPHVRIPHLASHILSKVAKRIAADWEESFAVKPVLMETFVDIRFDGDCYKAANWLKLGETRGRGRMDRYHEHAAGTKTLWVYPLCKAPRQALVK